MGEHAKPVKEALAGRGRGVDRLLSGLQRRAFRPERPHDVLQIAFETNLRKERQLEGIARAKVTGVYKGRQRR